MGTQQILLIVLSLILVGAAVSMGIIMFDSQARTQARNALITECVNFAIQAQAWYRTPHIMKGGEGRFEASDIDSIRRFINNGAVGDILTPTGTYTISAGSGHSVYITGVSTAHANVQVRANVRLDGTGDRNGIVWE